MNKKTPTHPEDRANTNTDHNIVRDQSNKQTPDSDNNSSLTHAEKQASLTSGQDYLRPIDQFANDPNYIAVGKIGRSHGLNGMVFVQTFTEPKANLFTYKGLRLGNGQSIDFTQHQQHAKQFIAQISGYDHCDAVKGLANQLIYLPTDHLPALPKGEFYWHQLHGCTVQNLDGFVYGTVDYIYDGAQFPIMVISQAHDKRKPETLIPYEDSTVSNVDIAARMITVDWTTDT